MWAGARLGWCAVWIAALVGCGGGGSGGEGPAGDGVLHVDVKLGGDLYLFQPANIRASISGLEGHTPNCVLKSGQLPSGTSLNRDCSVTGTPKELGSFQFVVDFSASNVSNHLDVYANLSVFGPSTIYSPPDRISVGDLVDWPTLNNFWTAGAQDTVTYALVDGALPPGLTLDVRTGRIHGMATTEGTWNPRIGVTVSSPFGTAQRSADSPLPVNVGGLDLRYGATGDFGGFAGFPMRSTVVELQPGVGYTFAWDGSQPPPTGLVLDPATGTVTGTPPALISAATYRVLVTVRGQGQAVSGSLIFKLSAGSPVYVRYDCSARINEALQCMPQFQANGGLNLDGATYRFALTSGYLPGTVALDPNTGAFTGSWGAHFNQMEHLTVTVTIHGVSFDIPVDAYLSIS